MSNDRYTGFTHCPICFESCGYKGTHGTASDGADYFNEDWSRPCPECNGTGMVPCDPRTLDDLENEEWSPATSAWFESIRELVKGAA